MNFNFDGINKVMDTEPCPTCDGRIGGCPVCNPAPTQKRDPVPEGCQYCPGCPDCLIEVTEAVS